MIRTIASPEASSFSGESKLGILESDFATRLVWVLSKSNIHAGVRLPVRMIKLVENTVVVVAGSILIAGGLMAVAVLFLCAFLL
jgi:hypothetical protein